MQIQAIPGNFHPDKNLLQGRTILITGAGSEIGQAIAIAVARHGGEVLLLDRKQREMAHTYDAIIHAQGIEPLIVEFDLRKAAGPDFDKLAGALAAQYPQLNGLVHCAAWGAPLTPIVHGSMDTWHDILDQQLIRPMYLTRSLWPQLTGDQPASVIFSSLDVGRYGRAYWGAVSSAYAGIENLSQVVGGELQGHNARCNTLDPGRVRTAIRRQFYPGEAQQGLRAADDPQLVNGYLYLLSDQSKQHCGRQFRVPDPG